MSKIGKKPITIPSGVTLTLKDNEVVVVGTRGTLTVPILQGVLTHIEDNVFSVTLQNSTKQTKSNWGTFRSLVMNAVQGVTEGFQKTLILEGVGYRVTKEGNNLLLALGFSHPVRYTAPEGIVFDIEKNTILHIKGIDKTKVGQVAAELRAMKKPEPYKGKGFHYSTEVVRRKAGKKAATGSGSS